MTDAEPRKEATVPEEAVPVTAAETPGLRRLQWVASAETTSFAVLLVGSVLRRTTEVDIVPVVGALHGALFVALVLLLVVNHRVLGWSLPFWLAVATVLSPGAHWAVAAERRERGGAERRKRGAGERRRRRTT